MNEILDALKTRLRSPVLGYFSIVFVAFNWKPIFYLLVQSGDVAARIEYFESNTSLWSLLFWPAAWALAIATTYPWLSLVLAHLTSAPVRMLNVHRARSEHRLLLLEKELEGERSKLLAEAEDELIDRAQRDQRLSEIESDEVRERLRAELDEMRAERDSLRRSSEPSASERHRELMDAAAEYRERARRTTSTGDRDRLLERAKLLEDDAARILVNRES